MNALHFDNGRCESPPVRKPNHSDARPRRTLLFPRGSLDLQSSAASHQKFLEIRFLGLKIRQTTSPKHAHMKHRCRASSQLHFSNALHTLTVFSSPQENLGSLVSTDMQKAGASDKSAAIVSHPLAVSVHRSHRRRFQSHSPRVEHPQITLPT